MITTLLPFWLISLTWLATGLMMVVVPSAWQGWVKRALMDPMKRLVLTLGMLFVGLLLMAGSTGLSGRWLWSTLGALIVIKALFLLGMSEPSRHFVLGRYERIRPLTHQLAGMLVVALATLLAIDTIRGPH